MTAVEIVSAQSTRTKLWTAISWLSPWLALNLGLQMNRKEKIKHSKTHKLAQCKQRRIRLNSRKAKAFLTRQCTQTINRQRMCMKMTAIEAIGEAV